MNNYLSAKIKLSWKQAHRLGLALVVFMVFVPGRALLADTQDDCLLKALQSADNSVTVGELRAKCLDPTAAVSDGPAEIILKTSLARKPAFFPHRRHQSIYPCATCHHGKDSSGRRIQYNPETIINKCTTCHNPDMPNMDLNGFKAIGHQLCRECHRTHQNITSAKCSTCHNRK